MSERPFVPGSLAPQQLRFDRSSGLPLGYFDSRPNRPRFSTLLLLLVLVFLL